MTRTITTAAELDALPDERVLLEASGRYRYGSGTFERCWVRPVPLWITGTDERLWEVLVHGSEIPHSLVHTEDLDLPVTVLHDPSTPAAQQVVSDAAVEAGARALADLWGAPGAPEVYRPEARAALSAALPFLGAAPSATREDVEGAIYDVDAASGEAVLEPSEIAWLADGLLARFTITPRTDR